MRESSPIALATSSTLASVFSQSAEIALIDDTRCAKNALATSFESSEDHTLVCKMRSLGNQETFKYGWNR